jgi:hypothetical protein
MPTTKRVNVGEEKKKGGGKKAYRPQTKPPTKIHDALIEKV